MAAEAEIPRTSSPLGRARIMRSDHEHLSAQAWYGIVYHAI